MNTYTVVLKCIASANGLGEFPYLVRADDEPGAVVKAREAHKIRNPKRNIVKQVLSVVEWPVL